MAMLHFKVKHSPITIVFYRYNQTVYGISSGNQSKITNATRDYQE